MKLKIKVIPKSSKSQIVEKDGIMKAYLHSAPEKGRANKELIELVAEKYNVSKSKVIIISGETGRIKLVEVVGL